MFHTHFEYRTDFDYIKKFDKGKIAQIMKNSNFTKIHNDWKSGKSIQEIAEYYGLDIPVVWSILLKDLEPFSSSI